MQKMVLMTKNPWVDLASSNLAWPDPFHTTALKAQLRGHYHPLASLAGFEREREEAQLPFIVNTLRHFCSEMWGFQ